MSMSTSAPPPADPPASPSNPERVRLAIAGAAAEAAIVRELAHRLMAGAAEDLHDVQRIAADAERALASAARALKAAIAPIKRQ
jgi:hypothetical protein